MTKVYIDTDGEVTPDNSTATGIRYVITFSNNRLRPYLSKLELKEAITDISFKSSKPGDLGNDSNDPINVLSGKFNLTVTPHGRDPIQIELESHTRVWTLRGKIDDALPEANGVIVYDYPNGTHYNNQRVFEILYNH